MYYIACFLIVFTFNLCLCSHSAWDSYQNKFNDQNREELLITNVEEDEGFRLKKNVKKWTSLNFGSVCYSAGLTEKSIILLTSTLTSSRVGFNISSQEIEVKEKPLEVILAHNRENGVSELIAIVAFHNKNWIELYRLQEKKMAKFWSWPVQSSVVHMNYYKLRNEHYLLLGYSEDNVTVFILYKFRTINKEPQRTILASLNLPEPVSASAFTNYKTHLFISFPQQQRNIVLTYKVETTFEFVHQIKSLEIENLAAFEIGFKSYLAIDGYNAGIYELTDDGWVKQNVSNTNLNDIYYWLPVPVQSYRDEMILFAQRQVNHGTHQSYVVEIITNNGGKFEEHQDIPCTHLGEKSEWLTCLPQDSGIKGSSYVYVEEKLGLIVPRPTKNYSELFLITYEIKQMPDPKEQELEMLIKMKEKLQVLLNKQLDEYEQLKHKTKLTYEPIKSKKSGGDKIGKPRQAENGIREKLENLRLELDDIEEKVDKIIKAANKTVKRIVINGKAVFEHLVTTDLNVDTIGSVPATALLEDIASKENLTGNFGNKTFKNIQVQHLHFQTVNGIKSEDLVTKKDLNLTLNGNIRFDGLVMADTVEIKSGNINDFHFSSEVISVNKPYEGQLKFEEIEVVDDFKVKELNGKNLTGCGNESVEAETFNVKGNLTVTYINSVNFTEFLNQLCFINTDCYLPGTVIVKGNITANDTYTKYLNGLKFPDDYILLDSVDHHNITGRKIFKNSASATEILTTGTVSGIDTEKLITKTTDQHIPGTVVFEDLEVTEELNVTGKILGDEIKQFLPNPTLEQVKKINANVIFKHLEVTGNIFVENFNGVNLDSLLDEIVYKNEEQVEIKGNKDFTKGLTIKKNLEIETNSINNVKLDNLLTLNTDQELDLTVLKGDVTINNLIVHGKYNGFNVTQFDESLVKLTGEQFISSTLIFNEDLIVNKLDITDKLNDLKADEYLYTSGNAEIDAPFEFETVIAENILVEGDFYGNISGVDIDNIEDAYLSFTKNQTIDVPFEIQNARVDNLVAEHKNYKDEDLLNDTQVMEEVWKILNSGSVQIENLVVDDSLEVGTINGIDVDILLPKIPFDEESLSRGGNITIDGDLYVNELEIDRLSSFEWDKFMKLLVFKNETNVVLRGTKHFTNEFTVDKLIETTKINNVRLENILVKDGAQTIRGPIVIEGDVVIQNLKTKTINNEPVEELFNRLEFSNGTYTVNGDVVFEHLQYIEDLHVEGMINDKDIKKTLSEIVFRNKDTVLEFPITFTEPVEIAGNLSVSGLLNGIDFSEIAPQIVLTTENATIEGPVVFSNPVLITDYLKVDGDMETDTLSGYKTSDWLEKAVFVNKGLLFGNYTFENITIVNELTTKFINDLNMEKIVPLRTDQYIDELEFSEVTVVNDVEVDGLVNGVKLPEEYMNTVMSDLEQEILTDVTFQQNVLVREEVLVDRINDKDPSEIVTTNTDQVLNGSYNFRSPCIMYSDLEVHGLINGINISVWNNSLKLFSPDVQIIDELTVTENITFGDNVDGNASIAGLDLPLLAEEVQRRINQKYELESGIIADYNNLCTDIKYLYKNSQTQIYKFRYFDDLQYISFRSNLENVMFFEHQDSQYLLASDDQCRSHLYIFNFTMFILLQSNIDTGKVKQVVPVYDGTDVLYLVLRSTRGECSVNGTNIWELDASLRTMQIKFKIEDQDLIQQSLVPGTFYGIQQGIVLEYKIFNNNYRVYRKWITGEKNAAFVPRGLKTGLALRTGKKIIYLRRAEPVEEDEFDLDSETVLRGTTVETFNPYLPGRDDREIIVIGAGVKSIRKILVAVTSRTPTVKRNQDIINIYENVLEGEVYQEIRTFKPSSLTTLDFEQGETLLVFLEDQRTLQIYEYKGIAGFKHRTSVKVHGSQLFAMTLPIEGYLNKRKALGIIENNNLRILQAVMAGNRLEDEFNCGI